MDECGVCRRVRGGCDHHLDAPTVKVGAPCSEQMPQPHLLEAYCS